MKSKAVDGYIARQAEFARPILTHLRGLIHKAAPGIEETIKWGSPSFERKGMVVGLWAFKAHVTVTFWKEKLLKGSGDLPRRITSLRDLPSDRSFIALVKQAVGLNESGRKLVRKKKPLLPLPPELAAAFAKSKHKKAKAAFEGMPPSHKREYIEWIVEAKKAETRERRVAKTLENLARGLSRNWKYEGKSRGAKA